MCGGLPCSSHGEWSLKSHCHVKRKSTGSVTSIKAKRKTMSQHGSFLTFPEQFIFPPAFLKKSGENQPAMKPKRYLGTAMTETSMVAVTSQ